MCYTDTKTTDVCMTNNDALAQFDEQHNQKFEKVQQHYYAFLNNNDEIPEDVRDCFFELSLSKAVRDNDCAAVTKNLLRVSTIQHSDFKQAVLRDYFEVFCILMGRADRDGADEVLTGLHAACEAGSQRFVDFALPLYLKANTPHKLTECVLAAGKGRHFDIVKQLIPYAFPAERETKNVHCLVLALIDGNYELSQLLYPHSNIEGVVKRLDSVGDYENAPQGLQWIDSQRMRLKLKHSVDDVSVPTQYPTQERTRKI